MRRERGKNQKDSSSKNILYLLGTVLGISIITFVITFLTYNNKTETMDTQKIADIVSNTSKEEISEPASSQISKTVEEVKEEALAVENEINTVTIFDEGTTEKNETRNTEEIVTNEIENTTTTNAETVTTEPVKKLEFIKPVEGNIMKEFAKDTLLYSETLKEWVTHFGIDIEANKATVVKAVEDGEVTAVKTDPRYGITVIIKHQDGFETRYANLLTSEYVSEGEMVTRGQTVGTVGNTAVFEIADNTHLHFEMLKDDEYINPNLYIND